MVQLLDALDLPTPEGGPALAHSIQVVTAATINDLDRQMRVGAPLLVVAPVDRETYRLIRRDIARIQVCLAQVNAVPTTSRP